MIQSMAIWWNYKEIRLSDMVDMSRQVVMLLTHLPSL